jgi:hypothetical protein
MKKAYPAKILLAWGEAISGNKPIREWLMKNGYPELGLFVFALNNKDDARKWLMDNGFPHLMALINGVEGNPGALEWLNKFGFDILFYVAKSGDGDEESYKKLLAAGHREFAVISLKIRYVKDEIERKNSDIHSISPE